MNFRLVTGAVLAWGLAGQAFAADMTLTPPAGGSVVVNSATATPGLKVAPGRQVQMPGLPSAASYSSVVCFDASGTLGQCTAGVLGTPGPQGPVGPAGPVGSMGAIGPAGPQGQVGPMGPTGPVGATGNQGPQGDPGPVGQVGPVGPVGPMGPAGAMGSQGVPGPVGAQGPVGPQGVAGPTGAAGPTGLTGATGSQGPAGATGATGPAGSGINGLTEARHGCFNGAGTVLRGTGFTVAVSANVYTVTYGSAMGNATYTVMMDARTNSGRSLAMGTTSSTTSAVFTVGWLEATESVASICFMAAR